jgi:hypothetical protein
MPAEHITMERNTAQSQECSSNGHSTAPADAIKQAATRLSEAREYVSHFLAAKLDSAKLSVRNVVLYAILGILGAGVGVGLLVTAAALLLTGLAGAIGAIFEPDKPWVGALIVGFVVIAISIIGVIIMIKKLTGASRKATIAKYEGRKRAQRNRFGHDVQERAREQVEQPDRK